MTSAYQVVYGQICLYVNPANTIHFGVSATSKRQSKAFDGLDPIAAKP